MFKYCISNVGDIYVHLVSILATGKSLTVEYWMLISKAMRRTGCRPLPPIWPQISYEILETIFV